MYHLYTSSGTVSDSSSTNRAVQVTTMISNQLVEDQGHPVQITPGQLLSGSNNYSYRMSDCV
jgi:hypothetical protein